MFRLLQSRQCFKSPQQVSRRGFLFAKLLPELLLAAMAASGVAVVVQFTPSSEPGSSAESRSNHSESDAGDSQEDRSQPFFNLVLAGDGDLIYSTIHQSMVLRKHEDPATPIEFAKPPHGVLRIVGVQGSRRLLVRGVDGSVCLTEDYRTSSGYRALATRGQRAVTAMAMSSCGRWAAAANPDTSFHVWDLDNPRESDRIEGLTNSAIEIRILPGADQIAVLDSTGLKLFERETHRIVHQFDFDVTRYEPMELTISQHGRLAAVVGFDGDVRAWDLQEGCELWRITDLDAILLTAIFSADNNSLLVGTHSGTVIEIDMESSFVMRELLGHHRGVRSLIADPGGNRFLTHGYDGKVKLWRQDFLGTPTVAF